jgi:hypothetical protein
LQLREVGLISNQKVYLKLELRSFQNVGTNALPLMGDFIGK